MMTLILYGTEACHLCEEAEAILLALKAQGADVDLRKVDIAEDDELMERYGVRIPVLRPEGAARELGWPFGTAEVLAFLSGDGDLGH